MTLLLDGLEVFNEDEEIPADHFLADRAAPAHLPKALAPDGHLPATMGRDNGPPIDRRGDLGNGEAPRHAAEQCALNRLAACAGPRQSGHRHGLPCRGTRCSSA